MRAIACCMTRACTILRLASIPLLVLTLAETSTQLEASELYPRLGLYGQMQGNGYPLWDTNGTLQGPVLDNLARYHVLVINASPISEYRPDAAAALRARRPDIKLLAYVQGHNIWGAQSADSLVHYPTRYRRTVRDLDGFLYDRQGREYPYANVNLAKRNAQGQFVVAESLAYLMYDAIVRTHSWDGIYFDIFCNSILFYETPTESIDYQRAGYPNAAAFDAAWHAGTDTLSNRLRRFAGPAFILVGNCGQGTKYASFNGWMRENFPYQNGGSWISNMYRNPGGYFTDEVMFSEPQCNFLSSWSVNPGAPYSTENMRRARLGLGSATLADGFGVMNPSDLDVQTQYFNWWYDEYAVNPITGQASTSQMDTGWLENPLGPAYQMVWSGTSTDGVLNTNFETDVTTSWRFYSYPAGSATVNRDGTTASVGSASAKLHMTSPLVEWSVYFATLSTLNLTAGQNYSATFWAKASTPVDLPVYAIRPSDNYAYAFRIIPISTTWKRYQAVFTPTVSGSATLQFWVGKLNGDVWVDDVHFQQGITNIYRRDFQGGIVLVNPTSAALNVVLERQYRRIQGVVDPVANPGGLVTTVNVPANDARFLTNLPVLDAEAPGDPAVLSLGNARPNPASGPMSLTLAIPVAGEVEVKIFNVVGREVAVLHRGTLQPGTTILRWDGRDHAGRMVPPGLYLARARQGNVVANRRMLRL